MQICRAKHNSYGTRISSESLKASGSTHSEFLMRAYLLILAAAFLSGCDSTSPVDGGVNCPDIARSAISVTPIDAITGDVLRQSGTASAVEGSYVDTHNNAAPLEPVFYLAYSRPGTYEVTVDIPNYRSWKLDNVVAKAGICGVVTVPSRHGC